jgi:hypothetical protein
MGMGIRNRIDFHHMYMIMHVMIHHHNNSLPQYRSSFHSKINRFWCHILFLCHRLLISIGIGMLRSRCSCLRAFRLKENPTRAETVPLRIVRTSLTRDLSYQIRLGDETTARDRLIERVSRSRVHPLIPMTRYQMISIPVQVLRDECRMY